MRYAELRPGLPASDFPPPLVPQLEEQGTHDKVENARPGVGIPRRLRSQVEFLTAAQLLDRDEFEDEDLDDMEFRKAGKSDKTSRILPVNLDRRVADEFEFNDIDAYDVRRPKHELGKQKPTSNEDTGMDWKPGKLRNGKWACNHKCKDKIG